MNWPILACRGALADDNRPLILALAILPCPDPMPRVMSVMLVWDEQRTAGSLQLEPSSGIIADEADQPMEETTCNATSVVVFFSNRCLGVPTRYTEHGKHGRNRLRFCLA